MSENKLSIIIPCYNSIDTLREAMDSCFVQGLSDFEIILVDDCSTDGTKVLMEELAKKHSEIKTYFHTENKGGGATRNTAVSNALNEIIFCLDSDDVLPPNTLSRMLAFMIEKKCDGVGIHHSIKFNGTNSKDIHHTDTFGYSGEKIPFESLLQTDGVLCPLYSTFMHSKSSFNDCGGYPTTHGFDTQGFAWRFLGHGFTAYTCPDASYYHRINFKPSYYIREANQGKVNYNWKDIFLEHFELFTQETKGFILNFNCADFTQNIFDKLRKRKNILRDDYAMMFGSNLKKVIIEEKRTYISRNSLRGTYLRLKNKSTRYIKLATEIGHGRSWRIDLLAALIMLRLKKMLKIQFTTPDVKGTEVDIVIPTASKDFDLLQRSIESIRHHLSHSINKIYIVSVENTIIQAFCNKHNYIFIDEKNLLGYGPSEIQYMTAEKDRSGWIFQQLLKLSGDLFTEKKEYIVVDSDTLFIHPHLFTSKNRYIFFQSEEYHPAYFASFKHLFTYNVKAKLSLTCHMMIFNTEFLREMKKELELKHGMSWDKAYLSTIDQKELSCVSDYDTYANWVHINHPDKVIFSPSYNRSLSRSELDTLTVLEKKYAKKHTSVSLHHYYE